MTDIYDQHKAAFRQVEAFVILKDGERVATIAFKFPADGAGRLYAYVHWLGLEMVRGFAAGGGYDKRSAACASAADKLMRTTPIVEMPNREAYEALADALALARDAGQHWDGALRDAGFTVLQAV